ncbi:SET and MYND domain-containing protein (SMYD)-like protein [Leptotrombidium deliense]|uniref:Protein-lysine N-methyltransferase SMYD4 n=1 Tax=Leptotrombidium deliense TaxID=299467 RepID=A0A443SJF0_9ACAR|nr:SET and MYND domain-containing protein (SMYD)-like protein [Leptotrombidium deliense]
MQNFSKYFKDAYKDFSEALELTRSQGDIPWLLVMKGKCLMKMGENHKAGKVFFQAEQSLRSSCVTEEMESRMIQELYSEAATNMEQGKDQYVDIPLLTEDMKTAGFSSSLQICTNEEKGRYVIVKEDIKKGTMLLSEDAVGFWLAPCRYEKCCNFCMKKLAKRYVSCRDCKAVRYCSLVCEHKAWTQYHSVECPFLDILKYFSSFHSSLRLVIRYGFDAILDTIDEGEIPLQFFRENGFPDNYRSVYSMFGHDSHIPFESMFAYCIGSLLLTRVAEVMGLIGRDSNEYCTFAAILLKHIFQISTNCFSLINNMLTHLPELNILVDHGDYTKNGIGFFLAASLFSHSCDCNCDRYTLGNQLVFVANRDIPAGEELSVTYGPSYKTMTFNERQDYLKTHYHFVCKCRACANKWENVNYAYRCTQCSGALVHNPQTRACCSHCGTNFRDVYIFEEKAIQAKRCLSKAVIMMQQNNLNAVKKNLDNALMISTRVHFSRVPQYSIHMYLLEYFSLKGDYYQMHVQCVQLALIHRELHGRDALQSAAYMIRATHLLLKHINSTTKDSAELIRARAIYSQALVILDEIKGRQVNVIEKEHMERFKLIPALNRMLQN